MQLKRPICKIAIGIIIGFIGGLYWGTQAVLLAFLGVCIFVIGLLLPQNHFTLIRRYFFSTTQYVSIICIIFTSIIANIYMQYLQQKQNTIQQELQEQTSWIAIIKSEKIEKTYTNQYVIQLENGAQCYLYVKKQKAELSYGDKILLKGMYQPFEPQKNTRGFDSQLYGKTKKLVGSIEADYIECIEQDTIGGIPDLLFSIRQFYLQTVTEHFQEPASYMIQALILGEKTHIPDDVMQDFRDSNLAHMLAISGAHISYIIVAIMTLERFCSKKSIHIFLLLFLAFFAILVGATPSVVRACIMSGMMILGNLIHRKNCVYTNMAISFIIMGIENPYCLWDLGLQLSYMGTLGILWMMPILQSYTHMWINCGRQT